MNITHTRFIVAPPDAQADGLFGWLSFIHSGSLRLGSVALRRSRSGKLDITFPVEIDRDGRPHAIFAPTDHESREAIRLAAIAAARAQGLDL